MVHNVLTHLLAALKFFRSCLGIGKEDENYLRQMTKSHLLEPILNVVYETMPRDNLLNSVCLEFFEYIKRENVKPIILFLVENYREKLQEITYVDTFQNLILRYDQMQAFNPDMDTTLFGPEGDNTSNDVKTNGNQRWQGVRDLDAAEEAYFNTSDDEDEISTKTSTQTTAPSINGASPLLKSLVDYPDDDDDIMDAKAQSQDATPLGSGNEQATNNGKESHSPEIKSQILHTPPPERVSEKRRREEDDDEEDELGKLSHTKRRSSSFSSTSSANSSTAFPNNTLRRKKGFATNSKDSPTGNKKIEISLAVKSPGEADHKRDEGG